MTSSITKEQVSNYYENHFTMIDLARIINVQKGDFERREFAWEMFPDNDPTKKRHPFRRNLRFNTMDLFIESIIKETPFKLYHGAVYKEKWSKTIMNATWERNELHFDIDVTESELPRKYLCECGKGETKNERKRICNTCLELVKEAGIFLIETLDEDLGIRKNTSECYFSGTRGIHVHYPCIDKFMEDKEDDKEVRRNIINYITNVTETTDNSTMKTKALITDKIESRTLKNRIERLVYKWFFLKSPENLIRDTNISPIAKNIIIDGLSKDNNITDILAEYIMQTNSPLVLKRQMERMNNIVMTYRYPRYDGSPTFDVAKVIKVPRSIDCNTGYIVTRIKNLDDFSLNDVDHVTNYVT